MNEGDPVVPLTSYQAGTALTNLADMTTLVFKGTVDEIDVGKLHEGMPAHIKIGALPEAKVEGKIYKISPEVQDRRGRDALRRGDRAAARRRTWSCAPATRRTPRSRCARSTTCCSMPERLVTFADGKATRRAAGHDARRPSRSKKEIKVGLSDGMNVEVAEGLKEKDLVVERPPKKIE